jgi:hypothetical protein
MTENGAGRDWLRQPPSYKPEAPAKDTSSLHWRFRVVCRRIPHGQLLTPPRSLASAVVWSTVTT